jgi:branched-chain amino acid aminotransferase
MRLFNYNGKYYEQDKPVIGPDSRALRYGDGLFETIKYKNNEFILLQDHLLRLWKGMDLMLFEKPKLFTKQYLRDALVDLVKKNKDTNARIRLSVFRANGGLYDAEHHHPQFIIQSIPLTTDTDNLNANGLQLCIYRNALKSCDLFSNIKHNNYLPYFMGALFAKANRCNDAIILNNHLRICDSSIANIFVVKNEIIYTPSLQEGCVEGVMRKFLLQQIPAMGIAVKETAITEEMLLEADELFLSNSIYNIRWVAGIAEKQYSYALTRKIFETLLQTNKHIFC